MVKKKRKMKPIIFIMIFLCSLFLGCERRPSIVEIYNDRLDEINTNIFGLVDRQGDYIYYVGGNYYNLYKMKIDGSENIKLCSDKCKIIGIRDNYVYYYKLNGEYAICRIDVEGKKKTILFKGNIRDQSLVDDSIYYIIQDYKDDNDKRLFKMSLDGQMNERVSKNGVRHYTVNNEWVYFINMDDHFTLYKIKSDGTNRTKLSNDCINDKVTIVGDRIFYIQYDNERIYSIGIDGTDKQPFVDYTNEENAARYSEVKSIQIHDSILYFVRNSETCSVNLDGSNFKSLGYTFSYDFVVDDKWIYTYVEPKYIWVERIEIKE